MAAHPADGDPADLAAIMRGGAEAALADGCPVLGGHTIDDPEPKYGLAVIGTAHPDRLMTQRRRARRATSWCSPSRSAWGSITTAEMARRGNVLAMTAAIASMLASNGAAAAAALATGVRCATDVTGFGLIGHLAELAAASGVGAEVHAAAIPRCRARAGSPPRA